MTERKSIKVSEQVHSGLTDFKESHGHSSIDSALREIMMHQQLFPEPADE